MFSRETWAESWERRAPLVEHLVPLAMQSLRPAAGKRVLDVGTGLAPLAIAVARTVAPGGVVHAVDVSPAILARARRRARDAGVSNLHFHELDAEATSSPGGPFDAAVSLLGVMFFANPVRAFANVRQQLRPGGRAMFVTWAESSANPLLAEVMLDRFAPGGLVHDTAGSFSMSDDGRLESLLTLAGFDDVAITRAETSATMVADVLFDELLLDVYHVPGERRPAARLHVQETLRAFESSRGIVVPLAINIATARNGPSLAEG